MLTLLVERLNLQSINGSNHPFAYKVRPFGGVRPDKLVMSPDEAEWNQIVPQRISTFVCPLQREYVTEKLGDTAFDGVDLAGYAAYEALNFVDGKRTLLDIAKAVSAEYGPIEMQEIHDFFKVLEKANLILLERI